MMKKVTARIGHRLEVRLSITVGLILVFFSLIAGAFTYYFAYNFQINQAEEQQRQLVRTVQAQAEVAVFAVNSDIAEDVIHGLLANPLILAARIVAQEHFKVELGSRQNINFDEGKQFPLFSPVDKIEPIGTLILVQNTQKIETTARNSALILSLLLLGQVFLAAVIMNLVLRYMAIRPIIQLANTMVSIDPGSSMRLTIASAHKLDEIGMLTHGVNVLLEASETAINKVKAQHEELERMATHDHLTGLPTVRLAEDRLRMACNNAERNQKKVALLFVDLDGFKAVNDTLGHEVGDDVLKETAKLLRLSIRAEDTAGRIGGDEFLVILTGLSHAQEAAQVAEKIIAAVTRSINLEGHSLQIGASIGIAIFPDDAQDMVNLRNTADQAMYKVKKSGKGTYAFA
jgi:diguanylate cyclase (GGDEF)-like protein